MDGSVHGEVCGLQTTGTLVRLHGRFATTSSQSLSADKTPPSLKISSFVFSKGSEHYAELKNESGAVVTELIPFDDFVRPASYDPAVEKSRHDDLMAFPQELHDFMRDHAKLTERAKRYLD